MKTLTYYTAVFAAGMLLVASSAEYQQEVEEHNIEQDFEREAAAEAHADTLGLTGWDRVHFINEYYDNSNW